MEWSGKEVQEGGNISIHIADSLTVQQKPTEAIILQLKITFFKKGPAGAAYKYLLQFQGHTEDQSK